MSEDIVSAIEAFRSEHKVSPEAQHRLTEKPRFEYYGKEVWEAAATALLCGENLLLVGPKATGKNVLAECLAAAFGRPSWDISFYINTDAASLIGTDTFTGGEVSFRQGPITKCAKLGGFGILDEINMAKNESLAVLHATLDFRRIIDVPGYDRIDMDPATRFIATMNYGYAGTRELNEALVSRFAVIDMPPINAENLKKLLKREYPTLRDQWGGAVRGPLRGHPQEVRQRRDLHKGPRPARTHELRAAHAPRPRRGRGAQARRSEQGLRPLRAQAGGGRHNGAHPLLARPGQAL